MAIELYPNKMYGYFVTTWIGDGKEFSEETQALIDAGANQADFPNEGPQRPAIPDSIVTYIEDVTGQFVHLVKNSPSPNVVVVKVGELRKKHQGGLSNLSVHTCGIMLERQHEVDGPMTKHITDRGLESWLKTQGMPEVYAKEVSGGERTAKMVQLAKACGMPVFDSEAIG
jgi:hypothetical protein